MKILYDFIHFAPYRDATILTLIENTQADIRCFVKERSINEDNHSEWNYISPLKNYEVTYKKTITFLRHFEYHIGFISLLRSFSPDVLIGSSDLEFVIAKFFNKNIKIVASSDTMREGSRAHKWWNKKILKILYSLPDAFWIPGKAGEKYFRKYIGDKKPIYFGSYTNDAALIYSNLLKSDRKSLRKEMAFDENDFVFLFVGKLIKTRYVEDLLICAEMLENENIKLLIIGDGENSNKVENYVNCHTNIKWIKKVSLAQLDAYYTCVDAYVHPGAEPYSLALYEAAIAGLPVVASKQVGAADDCLLDGENGYLFELHNVNQLAECMRKIKAGDIKQKALQNIQEYILKNRGIAWASDQLAQACGLK